MFRHTYIITSITTCHIDAILAIRDAGLSISFKCTSTSLFTGGTFLLKLEQFS